MEFLAEMIWYSIWPITVFVSLKFVQLNVHHFKKMERLEELEKVCGKKIRV
jgi:hypothetical protein